MSQVIAIPGQLNSIQADASPAIGGNVTLISGTSVSLVQSGQTITVNASTASGGFPSGAVNTLQYNAGSNTFGGLALGSAFQLVGMNSGATANAYLTLAGTSNQVIVTNSGSTITLSLPQSINSGASPTFAGLTLSSPLTVANGGTGISSLGTAYQLLGVNSAATANTYLTLAGTSHQVIVTNSGTSVTLSTPQNIDTTSSPTFQALTLGSTTPGGIILNDTEVSPKTVTVIAPATLSGTYTFTLPTTAGSNLQVLQTDGSGNTSWASATSYAAGTGLALSGSTFNLTTPVSIANGGTGLTAVGNAYQVLGTNSAATAFTNLTLAGTTNQVILNSSGTTTTFSLPQSIATSSTPTFGGETLSGNLTLENQSGVIFQDTEGSPKSVTIEAPATVTTSYTLKLPAAQGANQQTLLNDGSGNLSWTNLGQDVSVVGSVKVLNHSVTSAASGTLLTTPNDGTTHMYIVQAYVTVTTAITGGSGTLNFYVDWYDPTNTSQQTTAPGYTGNIGGSTGVGVASWSSWVITTYPNTNVSYLTSTISGASTGMVNIYYALMQIF
jgi:hypothetical protein